MKNIANALRYFLLKRVVKKIKKALANIETNLMDDFLELLLKMIRLALQIDPEFRRNIKDFSARYTFRSQDNKIAASAVFDKNQLEVSNKKLDNTNVTVIFKDGKALWEFLMSKNPDVFAFILENKLTYKGNLNYILKFGYMARHLALKFGM
jgi:DNA-directed RNA polymerase alpha subunit